MWVAIRTMMKKAVYIMCLLALLLTSCSTPKPVLTVFKDIQPTGSGELMLQGHEITIRPHDELMITVTSTVPTASAPYNLPLSNPAKQGELKMSQTPYQQTYIVNKDGDINFPVIGKIHVEGLTTLQLTEQLAERIAKDVKDPVVRVELVNFFVNVIGEVRSPGRKEVAGERFSILDALAAAGHMTEYGDRTNVLIIRENDGKAEYHYVDLTKSDIVTSPYYYLQQNDVVMVSPTPTRESNSRYDSNNAYRMQVVSTIVSAASVIASLVIALTVK